ncbi:unnamed protein product [Boreogadus saida]
MDQEQEEEAEIKVEATWPNEGPRKKDTIPGEMAEDEALTDAERAYTVERSSSGTQKLPKDGVSFLPKGWSMWPGKREVWGPLLELLPPRPDPG